MVLDIFKKSKLKDDALALAQKSSRGCYPWDVRVLMFPIFTAMGFQEHVPVVGLSPSFPGVMKYE